MLKIELIPDMDHCIETAARKKHAAITRILLQYQAGNAAMEEQLETLRIFLETADFRQLRAESEKHLSAGENVRFIIYREGDGVRHEMHVT